MNDNNLFLTYVNRFNEVKAYEVELIAEDTEFLSVLDVKENRAKSFKKSNIIGKSMNLAEAEQHAQQMQNKYEIIPKNKTGKTFANPEKKFEVCFTGFPKTEKEQLIKMAEQHEMFVRTRVTSKLGLLVCGDNAGWAKIKEAAELDVPSVFGLAGFENFINTGEMSE